MPGNPPAGLVGGPYDQTGRIPFASATDGWGLLDSTNNLKYISSILYAPTIQVGLGSTSAPAYTCASAVNTGIAFNVGSPNRMAFVASGTMIAEVSSACFAIINGYLAAPSYTDNSTGAGMLFSGASGNVYFRTGVPASLTRLFIDQTTGNIGIPSTSPNHKLELWGNALIQGPDGYNASGEMGIVYLGDTASWIRGKWGSGVQYGTPSGAYFGWFINNAEIMRLETDNVLKVYSTIQLGTPVSGSGATYGYITSETVNSVTNTLNLKSSTGNGTSLTVDGGVTKYFHLKSDGNIETSGKITKYNAIATLGAGVPFITYYTTATSQTTTAGPTNITNTNVAGLYRVHIYYSTGSVNAASATCTGSMGWTGRSTTHTKTGTQISSASLANYYEFTVFVYNDGANYITFTFTVAGGGSGGTFDWAVTAERLN
jgi:hypothetical protein